MMKGFVPSSVRSYLRLDAPPDVGVLLEARQVETFTSYFATPAEAFSLLCVADVRRALMRDSARVGTLVRRLTHTLERLRDDAAFCPAPPPSRGLAGWTPFGGGASSAAAGAGSAAQDAAIKTREALNCIRILTRILPVIMEGDHDATCDATAEGSGAEEGEARASLPTHTFERALFDSRATHVESEEKQQEVQSPDETDTQFVIDDEEDGDVTPSDPLSAAAANLSIDGTASKPEEDTSLPTLCERMVTVTLDLLFRPGFSVPWTGDDQLAARTIWEQGVGSSVEVAGTTREHESHRLELLRLLLVLLSKAIYLPAHAQAREVGLEDAPEQPESDPALRYVASQLGRATALPLLCSLLNTAVRHASPDSSWLGGLSGLASVPAGLAGASAPDETRSSLASLCLQTLNVLLGWEPPSAPFKVQNVMRFYLSKLHRHEDFVLVSSGLLDALAPRGPPLPIGNAAPSLTTGGTPGRGARVGESLLLLWRLLTHNARFRVFLLDDAVRAPLLLSRLLTHALQNKDSAAQAGLVRLCIFILQDCSAEKAFGAHVCAPGSGARIKIPGGAKWGVVGGSTAADTLVQAAYTLMASTRGALSTLYAPLVIALANTAPAWRGLSVVSSSRLASLLSSFSAPSFLLADEGNPRLAFFLLEALNAALHHHARENPNLTYALLRNHAGVRRLATFTLRRGIAEMRRTRRLPGTDSPTTLMSPAATREGADPLDAAAAPASDKARGKMRQTSLDVAAAAAAEASQGTGAPATTSYGDGDDGILSALAAQLSDGEVWDAARAVGRNGFVPTQDWVASWQKGLPLDTLQITLAELLPKVEAHCASSDVAYKGDADERVLAFLREQDLSQVLPPAPPVYLRPFRWNEQARIWILSYLWGLVYVSAQLPFGIYAGTSARLFHILAPAPRTRTSSSTSAVSGVLGALSRAVPGTAQ